MVIYLPTHRPFIFYEGDIIFGKLFGWQSAFFICLCGRQDFFCIAKALSGLFIAKGPGAPAQMPSHKQVKNNAGCQLKKRANYYFPLIKNNNFSSQAESYYVPLEK